MEQEEKGYWYNCKIQDYEYIETPSDFSDYISQNPSAQELYQLYQEMGDTPIIAAQKVLRACAGVGAA